VATAFAIPELPEISTTHFLNLQLFSAAGDLVSRNFYWLSSKPDVLDFSKTEWYYTPLSGYADFTALQSLPKADVHSTLNLADAGEEITARILLDNSDAGLAFLVRLRLLKGKNGAEILPIFWEDNYLVLLPGEKREVTARIRKRDLGGATPTLAVDGFNVAQAASTSTH
jgi:exo-1,4-beta-D-glucosaminidase